MCPIFLFLFNWLHYFLSGDFTRSDEGNANGIIFSIRFNLLQDRHVDCRQHRREDIFSSHCKAGREELNKDPLMRALVARTILAVGLLFGFSGAALATLIYSIGDPNTALNPFPGPYAEASVTFVDSTHASVVFTSLSAGGFTYLLGAVNALDLNVGATSFSISPSPVTAATLPGFTTPSCTSGGSGNVSSFGVFNLTINCFDGFPNAGNMFSFTLTNTSGTWASEADILTANASGNFAAGHVFVCDTPCTVSGGALVTGFAGNSEGGFPPVIIPEPQTLALLGLGLLVLGLARRRQRS